MNRRQFILGTTGFVGASSVGAVAFTSATVEREVDVTVAADDPNGVIGLTQGVGTSLDSNGNLVIDADDESLNPGPTGRTTEFTYGQSDPASSSEAAFTITNNDGEEHTFEFSSGVGAITFEYTLESNGTIDETVDPDEITLKSGNSVYITYTVETTGVTSDISGNVTIAVSE